MTRSDTHPPEPRRDEPDIWFLPEIVALEAALRRYRKPRYRAHGGKVEEVLQAVEITVETSEPFPVRALGPVLLIGRAELSESERVGPNRYRFYGYEPEKLKEGTPIRLGWFGESQGRKQTGFRFELAGRRGS